MARIIGLTGGIACGKTAVSSYLREKGIQVIDADIVSRELCQAGGAAIPELKETFGGEFLQEDGSLDRKKMGRLVFSNPAAREQLNQLLHPLILKEIMSRAEASREKLVVVDAALLIETGLFREMEEIWLVTVDEQTQLHRLMERDGFSKEEALSRIHSQMPVEEKRRYAHRVIDNSGNLLETYAQVDRILGELI